MIVSKHPGNGFILGNAWVRKKRSKKEQALVVTNLVLGIRFIHERGVTHNDLHSGNWLVGPNSEIRFIDFDRATIRCGPTEFNTVVYDPDHDLCELIWHALNTLNLCRSVRRAIRRACGCEHVVLPCLEGSDQITGWWGHSDVLGSLADWKLHDMNTPFHPKSPRVLTRYSNNYPMYPKLVIEDNPGANPGVFLGLAVDFHDFEASRSPGRPPQASFVDEGAILDALGFFLTHGRFP
jgi:serine/threonine protein kinase